MIRSVLAVSLTAALASCAPSPEPTVTAQETRPDPLPGTRLSVEQLKAQIFHVSAGKRLKGPWPDALGAGGGPVVRCRQRHRVASTGNRDPVCLAAIRRGHGLTRILRSSIARCAVVLLHPGGRPPCTRGDERHSGKKLPHEIGVHAGSTSACCGSTTRRRSSAAEPLDRHADDDDRQMFRRDFARRRGN